VSKCSTRAKGATSYGDTYKGQAVLIVYCVPSSSLHATHHGMRSLSAVHVSQQTHMHRNSENSEHGRACTGTFNVLEPRITCNNL